LGYFQRKYFIEWKIKDFFWVFIFFIRIQGIFYNFTIKLKWKTQRISLFGKYGLPYIIYNWDSERPAQEIIIIIIIIIIINLHAQNLTITGPVKEKNCGGLDRGGHLLWQEHKEAFGKRVQSVLLKKLKFFFC
jgi:hypothetical protein